MRTSVMAQQAFQSNMPQALGSAVSAVEEGLSVTPALVQAGSTLTAQSTLDQANLASAYPGFSVGNGTSAICFSPAASTTTAGAAQVQNGAAALYPDTTPGTDTVLRPTSLGVQAIQQLNNSAAPTSLTWIMGLQPGWQLKQLDDGAIAIVDPTRPTISAEPPAADVIDPFVPPVPFVDAPSSSPDKTDQADPSADVFTASDIASSPTNPALEQDPTATESEYQNEDAERQYVDWTTDGQAVGFITPPWARDANGTVVPVSLSTDGISTVTMTLDTSAGGYAYPLTASDTQVAMDNAARARHHVRYGIADQSYAFLSDSHFPALRHSKAMAGGLTLARTGLGFNNCDQWDGAMTNGPPAVADLSKITDNSLNGQRCRNAANFVLAVTGRINGVPGITNDPEITIGSGCNYTGVCVRSSAPPCVNISHGQPDPNGSPNPAWSLAHYQCSVLALWKTYPFTLVKSWVAYNEPDAPNQPFSVIPPPGKTAGQAAADTWRRMQHLATGLQPGTNHENCQGCTIVAGEILNHTQGAFMVDYLGELHGHHSRPLIWALHPYDDVVHRRTTQTHQFLKDLGGTASGSYWHFPTIWLDESGVDLGDTTNGLIDHAALQAAAARTFLRLASVELKASETAGHNGPWRPIRRVYYYEWKSDHDWSMSPRPPNHFDSALLNINSQPRPAYCVLAGLPPNVCTQDGL